MPKDEQVCNTCTYFKPMEHSGGRCRMSPPTVHVVSNNHVETYWPWVGIKDWCGLWVEDTND